MNDGAFGEQAVHCPFLNIGDQRCAEHCKMDHLQYAFNYCFGDYKDCSSYTALLAERQMRRLGAVGAVASNHGYNEKIVQVRISPSIAGGSIASGGGARTDRNHHRAA